MQFLLEHILLRTVLITIDQSCLLACRPYYTCNTFLRWIICSHHSNFMASTAFFHLAYFWPMCDIISTLHCGDSRANLLTRSYISQHLLIFWNLITWYGYVWIRPGLQFDNRAIISVRPSTPFSTDTDTPIFCCQPIPIPIRFKSGRGAVWLTDKGSRCIRHN